MDGGDDLAASLRNYEIQLQQVLSALADESTPDQAELLKLKEDLSEVIALTKDLMSGSGPTSSSSATNTTGGHSTTTNFRAGHKVLAPWSEDGLYYEAILDEVMSDGQCNVTFCDAKLRNKDDDSNRKRKIINEVCLISLLRPCEGGSYNRPKSNYNKNAASTAADDDKRGKQLSREDLKKKQQKRLTKLKEAEEEQEKVKRSWQSFSQTKKGSNKKKGLASAIGKKHVSIFASPDGVDGRVGIGTCGISGRGMTAYVSNTSVTTATNSGTALHHSSFQKKKQMQAAASGLAAVAKK